jgi:hypothetical protein
VAVFFFLLGISVISDSVVSSRRGHAGGVLQGGADDLGRIDDPRLDQVAVLSPFSAS